jgi:hypothetical protein
LMKFWQSTLNTSQKKTACKKLLIIENSYASSFSTMAIYFVIWPSHASIVTNDDVMYNVFLWYRAADSTGEVLKGIRLYFDKALPMMLLYKKERKQCSEAVGDNASPSTIYGAEHLLRLFGMFTTFRCF